MNSDQDKGQTSPSKDKSSKGGKPKTVAEPATEPAKEPEWAGGLRELYDSVVEEPLPDSFKDLLSKLDGDK